MQFSSPFLVHMTRFIGRPWMKSDCYPWRPMGNRERRARWSVLYYLENKPFCHAIQKGNLTRLNNSEACPVFGIQTVTEFADQQFKRVFHESVD